MVRLIIHQSQSLSHTKKLRQIMSKLPPVVKRGRGRPKGSGWKQKGLKERPPAKSRIIETKTKEKRENGLVKLIEVTPVFTANKKVSTPRVINRGGARSSKTFSIIQILTERLFSVPDRKILVTRKTMPSLRVTTMRDMIRYLKNLGLYQYCNHVKMTNDIEYRGSYIHFGGFDDPEKIKSSEWNDIFVEEMTEFTYADYMTMKTRMSAKDHGVPNQLFGAFNPTDENHWIKKKLIDVEDPEECTEIVSTWKMNPFLSPLYIKELLALQKQDENFYRIFTLGEWGRLSNLIFARGVNWDICHDKAWPQSMDETWYGLDFGFNNPSALVEINLKDNELYVRQLLYQAGLTNKQLINRMLELGADYPQLLSQPLFSDSAEKQRIVELQDTFTAWPAKKEVVDGIDTMKSFKIHIHEESTDLIKEFQSYSWIQNKNGEIIDQPVKFNDHGMDAVRYGIHSKFDSSLYRPFISVVKQDEQKRDEDAEVVEQVRYGVLN